MFHQPPGSGVLLPALHCASIALELYLKSLSAREIEKRGPIGEWKYIYAEATAKSHKLEDLFDQAPPDIQQLIEQAGGRRERCAGSGASAKCSKITIRCSWRRATLLNRSAYLKTSNLIPLKNCC